MLDKIEQFFRQRLTIDETHSPEDTEQRLMIATTALFLEMALADFALSPDEEVQMKSTLADFFSIEDVEIEELIALARQERNNQHDIYSFTRLIKENFDRSQRLRILEKLWQLIYADGTVDKYEDALIRKITNLLGLEHQDMIQAKFSARNKINE